MRRGEEAERDLGREDGARKRFLEEGREAVLEGAEG